MPSIITNVGISKLSKEYWESGADIRVALLGTGYTPNRDHASEADIEAEVIVATNYASAALAGRVATIDNPNDRVDYSANSTGFGVLGGAANDTMRYAAIFEELGGASSANPLLIIVQNASDLLTTGAVHTQNWSNPILRRQQA